MKSLKSLSSFCAVMSAFTACVMGGDVPAAPQAHLKSEGVAHETKSSFHFTVNGKGVLFDDVRFWNAAAR